MDTPRLCWVKSQRSAKLRCVLAGLERARAWSGEPLCLQHRCALHDTLGESKHSPPKATAHYEHRLRWHGAVLLHYVPFGLNPADPISCWFSGKSARPLIVTAKALEGAFRQCAWTTPWGVVADKDISKWSVEHALGNRVHGDIEAPPPRPAHGGMLGLPAILSALGDFGVHAWHTSAPDTHSLYVHNTERCAPAP